MGGDLERATGGGERAGVPLGKAGDLVATVIAIVAALGAAICFAIGSFIQQSVARESGDDVLRVRLLLDLARQPRWVAGVGLNVFSFAILAIALAFGPLTLVLPLAATDVLFALPLIARKHRRRLTRRDLLGAGTVTVGIATFLAVSPPAGGVSVPGATEWALVFLAVGALAALSAMIAVRVSGPVRVVWLAAAAGGLYGLLDALTKASVSLLAAHGAGVLVRWEPYAMLGAAGLGALFGQSAFGAGALSLSLPVIDTLEPVSAVVIGATVFGEQLASSPVEFGFQVAGGAAAAAGIALLSRSAIVAAESSESPGPPERPAGGPGGVPGELRERPGELRERPAGGRPV